MRNFIDPYNYDRITDDFLQHNDDVVDKSGYLPLKDELKLIREQSLVNYELLKAKRDAYYDSQSKLHTQLQEFENSPEAFEQLSKLRQSDMIDVEKHYKNAYAMYSHLYNSDISDFKEVSESNNLSDKNVNNETTPAE